MNLNTHCLSITFIFIFFCPFQTQMPEPKQKTIYTISLFTDVFIS